MKMDIKKKLPIAALTLVGMSSSLSGAMNNDACGPTPAATCYADDCECHHCLGPDVVNPSVRPRTCNGDFSITVAGFYWSAHQCGMEYALKNNCSDGVNLIKAEYLNPDFDWDFGFRLGLDYASAKDGWDIGVFWTRFSGHASDSAEADNDDGNSVLLPIWSAYTSYFGGPLQAASIDVEWKLALNLVDIELGREFWTSKYLTMRPHIGVRIAWINQDYNHTYKGGDWNPEIDGVLIGDPNFGFVVLENDFRGAGLRAGLDTVWNLGCGWGIYGNFAFSIIYGRFDIDHDEYVRECEQPFTKQKLVDSRYSFRVGRAITDLNLGVQWQTMFCAGQYALTAMLGWEQHLFFDQNQLWRVVRNGSDPFDPAGGGFNNTGENVYHHRRGDLDTQGWTLTFRFDF